MIILELIKVGVWFLVLLICLYLIYKNYLVSGKMAWKLFDYFNTTVISSISQTQFQYHWAKFVWAWVTVPIVTTVIVLYLMGTSLGWVADQSWAKVNFDAYKSEKNIAPSQSVINDKSTTEKPTPSNSNTSAPASNQQLGGSNSAITENARETTENSGGQQPGNSVKQTEQAPDVKNVLSECERESNFFSKNNCRWKVCEAEANREKPECAEYSRQENRN